MGKEIGISKICSVSFKIKNLRFSLIYISLEAEDYIIIRWFHIRTISGI